VHGHSHELLAFLILILGSLLMPVLSGRLRVPSAILLIFYGILVGPHVLGLVHDDAVVGFLSEVGFMVLMFMAGLEIDFREIARRGRWPLLLMVLICFAVFALAFVASNMLGLSPIFGIALGAVSVGLPLAILNETGMLRSPLGQTVVLLGSLGEFLTVVGMTVFYFAARYGLSVQLFFGLGKLVVVLALAALALRTLMACAWWWPEWLTKLSLEHKSAQIGVRAALVLMMAFSLMAMLAGVEAIVGAFIAGAVIAFVFRGKEALEHKLSVVGHGLFVPIFFVVVGARFDPATVTVPSLALAGQLLVAALLVKLLPCLALARMGLGLRDVLGTGLLLSAPLTLVVAIAAIGVSLAEHQPEGATPVLTADGQGALLILAVASGVLFPVIFRLITPSKKSEAPKAEIPREVAGH